MAWFRTGELGSLQPLQDTQKKPRSGSEAGLSRNPDGSQAVPITVRGHRRAKAGGLPSALLPIPPSPQTGIGSSSGFQDRCGGDGRSPALASAVEDRQLSLTRNASNTLHIRQEKKWEDESRGAAQTHLSPTAASSWGEWRMRHCKQEERKKIYIDYMFNFVAGCFFNSSKP